MSHWKGCHIRCGVVVLPHEILGSILYFLYSDECLCSDLCNAKVFCYSDQKRKGIKESVRVKHRCCKFHQIQPSITSNKLEKSVTEMAAIMFRHSMSFSCSGYCLTTWSPAWPATLKPQGALWKKALKASDKQTSSRIDSKRDVLFNSQIKDNSVFHGTGGNLSINIKYEENSVDLDSHDVVDVCHTKLQLWWRLLGTAEVSHSKLLDLDWIQALLEDFVVNIIKNITASVSSVVSQSFKWFSFVSVVLFQV